MKRVVPFVVLVLAGALGASSAEPRKFTLDPARSSVTVRTGKAGLFSFAGHSHLIRAGRFEGDVVADATALSGATVSVTFEAASLTVSTEGEPAADVAKVQARMTGSELLDVSRFPEITFRSTKVTGRPLSDGRYDLSVAGDLTLHGVTVRLELPVHTEVVGNTLTAEGEASLRQTAFGLTPVSVAGVVKVRDEVVINYKFVGTATP